MRSLAAAVPPPDTAAPHEHSSDVLAGLTPPNKVPPFGSNSGHAKGKQIMRGGFKFSKRSGNRDGSDSPLLQPGSNDLVESPLG